MRQLLCKLACLASFLLVFNSQARAQAPLQRLLVSANGRFLVTANGAPCSLLMDTAWFLPKVSETDVTYYLDNRTAKGFNTILIAAKYHSDILYMGLGAFDNNNTDTPNSTFWQHMDFVIDQAAQRGLYVALTIMWAEDWVALVNGDTTKAAHLGTWLGTRYANRPNLFWVISGEYADTAGWSKAVYDSAAQAIRQADGGSHLMTIHGGGGTHYSSSATFQSSTWLDFNMIQSGHYVDNEASNLPENHTLITTDYGLTPIKPTFDGENAYEDIPDQSTGLRVTADTNRRKAYWGVFAGGFGHTYGNENIEIMYVQGDADYGFTHRYWKDALDDPGAQQMIYIRRLMESRSFLNRIPDQSIVTSALGSHLQYIQATRASDGSYAFIYIPDGRPLTVDLRKITGVAATCSWYDPRTGSTTAIGQFANTGTYTFDPPGDTANGNDWILILDSVPNQPPTVSLTSPVAGASFTAPAFITLTASASDTDGTIAKVDFFSGGTLLGTATTAPYTFTWNPVPAGNYTLTARATDNLGATTVSSGVAVTVNQPPTVALTSPAAGASFTAPASITLTASASDTDGTIAKVDFFSGGTLLGTATTAPYTFTWNPVSAGNYTLTARAADNLGATTLSSSVAVTVNQLPTVALTSPAAGASFTAPASITLIASASDTDGTIAKVDFFSGGTLLGTATTAPYTLTWNPVSAGTYTLTVRATDNRGATTVSGGVAVTVNQPPTVALTSPVVGARFTAPASITLTASASDTDGTIAKVDFFSGGSLLGTATTAPYTFTWNPVSAGNYTLTARAADNLGATTLSSSVAVTVNQLPTVALTSPAAGASFTAPASITLTASASDTDGTIAKVDFFSGGTLLGAATTAPYTFTWNPVSAGSYTLTARATDNGGATTVSGGVAVTVNQPPTVALTSPAAGASFTAPASITLTASASDTDGTIAKVDFFSGGTLLGTVTTAPYTFTWNQVPAGSYTLTARATDNRGATTVSTGVSISVTADSPPTVAISSPSPGATFPFPGTVSITASAADSDGSITKVDFYANGTILGTVTKAPYTYTWRNPTASGYTLTAQATDNQGATTLSAGVTITIQKKTH